MQDAKIKFLEWHSQSLDLLLLLSLLSGGKQNDLMNQFNDQNCLRFQIPCGAYLTDQCVWLVNHAKDNELHFCFLLTEQTQFCLMNLSAVLQKKLTFLKQIERPLITLKKSQFMK